MADLICIPTERVAEFWPLCRAMVLRAITKTGLGHTADIDGLVTSGGALLWIVPTEDGATIEAAAVTRLVLTDTTKVCKLEALGGSNRGRWLHLLEGLESYAREAGCSRLRIYGRRGWARELKGYAVKHVILERSL